jgi:ABC-2 type transport system permease protein
MNALHPYTRALRPLLLREWIQHRFAWALLALIPLGLAALTAAVGHVEFGDEELQMPQKLPLLLAVIPAIAGTALMLVIALVTAFVQIVGLARRDHADRSIEYWLSLPVPHAAALGVPLLVHMILMPAAALLVGWLGGQLVGALLVGRVIGLQALADLPWADMLAATSALFLRFAAGLPIAALWAAPLIMLLVLLNAWFKRWGFVVLIVGLGLLSLFEQITIGQRWLLTTAAELLRRAGLSLIGAGGESVVFGKGADDAEALTRLPRLAAMDFAAALQALASPLFVGGLVFSVACFALVLHWRRFGAGRGD